jgi:hypothetical protein
MQYGQLKQSKYCTDSFIEDAILKKNGTEYQCIDVMKENTLSVRVILGLQKHNKTKTYLISRIHELDPLPPKASTEPKYSDIYEGYLPTLETNYLKRQHVTGFFTQMHSLENLILLTIEPEDSSKEGALVLPERLSDEIYWQPVKRQSKHLFKGIGKGFGIYYGNNKVLDADTNYYDYVSFETQCKIPDGRWLLVFQLSRDGTVWHDDKAYMFFYFDQKKDQFSTELIDIKTDADEDTDVCRLFNLKATNSH